MKIRTGLLSLFCILLSCSPQQKNKEAQWKISSNASWLNKQGLLNTESILYDQEQEVFYATNGLNYKSGTDGFISKISREGELIELKWIDSLNRPTGMALQDSMLYVADVNSLIKINTEKGEVIDRIPEPIANSGLNDVAIDEQGEVFVSASFIHAVLKVNEGKLDMWLQDEKELRWANGLLAEKGKLIIAGLKLSSIKLDSKKLTSIVLNPTIKDFDGIASDGLGGYFLTTVENSALYHLDGKNNMHMMLAADAYFGDLCFLPDEYSLYIPRGNKEKTDFFVSEILLERKLNKE